MHFSPIIFFGRLLHPLQTAGRTLAPYRIALVIAILPSVASGQNATGSIPGPSLALLTATQLQADFAIFKRAYQELHPGLYRYNTKSRMDANFQQLQQRLSSDLTLSDAYLAFATFLTKIKCGHCYPNFYNQPTSVVQALFKNQDRVPFHFRWIDRRMIVTQNCSSDARLVPGTEVLSINSVPVRTILKTLMTVSRADGSNDNKRVSNLEIRGTSRYEAFDIYFPMFFPLKEQAFFLQVRSLRGGNLILQVDALNYEQRIAPYKAQIESLRGDQPIWDLRFLNDQTADLRMPTWAVFNSKWDWNKFLDHTFAQIAQKRVQNLVIDLRSNEGGSDIGNVLLSKFIQEDLRPAEQFQRWVRYRKVPDDLKPYLDTWDFSFQDWGDYAHDPKEGFYRMTKFDDDASGDVIHAALHPYTGHIYVLVDASNSSATFQFAKVVQQNHLGTLVGQSTGGNQRGINGGAFFFLNLPNSKIETDLPLVGYYPSGIRPSLTSEGAVSLPDAGLTPDIVIKPRIEDIQQGVDTELKSLLQRLAPQATPAKKSRSGFHSVLSLITPLLILLAGSEPAQTQELLRAETIIPSARLQKDVSLLKAAFEELHPGLYRYNSKNQIDATFANLETQFSHDASLQQVYLALSAFCAEVRCGHTYPNFFNQSKAVKSALFERSDKLPFFFRWIDGHMMVTRDFTPAHLLPPGTEITSINGTPVQEILRKLFPYVRGDGSNNFKRIDLLQIQGEDTYDAIDVYLPMILDCSTGSYRLVMKPLDKRLPRTVDVRALSFAERQASVVADLTGDTPLFKISYLDNNIALLSMPTWEMYNSKWDWETWLNHTLDEVVDRKCRALIIDLRGNEGGNDVGATILRRLVDRESAAPAMLPMVRFQKLPQDLKPFVKGWDDAEWESSTSTMRSPLASAPKGIVYFLRNEEDTHQHMAPTKHFHGQVYVLIDSSASSATFNFSQAIQTGRLGKLIGEPTGGNKRGINGGQFIFLRLPNSGIEVDIPLVGTFPLQPQADEGLKPDVRVGVTRESIVKGTDPVLDRTMKLIPIGKRSNEH